MNYSAAIRLWQDPPVETIASEIEGFLRQLGGPTAMMFKGRDRSRCRAIVTLLHGNEPSGLIAIHRWLRNFRQPAVDTLCFVGSVRAASHESLFKHRMLPGARDLNRCFQPPFDIDEPGRIAGALLQLLNQLRPECLIDIHNTSGRSGAFGVVTHEDPVHEALVAPFSHRLIVTNLRLGALMEVSGNGFPAVTVECGGADDADSAQVAWQGLDHLLFEDDVLHLPADHFSMDAYHHPVRLELSADCSFRFADEADDTTDFTVPTNIERLNFGVVGTGQMLGWLGRRGAAVLRVKSADGGDQLSSYFTVRDGCLYPAQALKLFMVTTNPAIARSDCLLYATPESDHTVIDV